PSGRASLTGAVCLGTALLLGGVGAAAQVSPLSLGLAGLIAIAALTYDRYSKHHSLLGPVNMGLCRSGNLLLGISAAAIQVQTLWFLAAIPLAYIGAITAISQGEVNGGQRRTGIVALCLLGGVIGALLALGLLPGVQAITLWPFGLLLAGLVVPSFWRAAKMPTAEMSRAAVKAGVLSLIVLDAALASGFGGWLYGLCVLALLPLSAGLARLFVVT
ncbi:MAG: hypothetical protein WBB01_25315, partial [Phormidesmis sp.]